MKTLTQIQDEAITLYSGRELFKDLSPLALNENIKDIVAFASLETAQAIKGAELKKKILVLDTEGKTESQLEDFFANVLEGHEITSIDQIGKQKFAVTTLKNAPDFN